MTLCLNPESLFEPPKRLTYDDLGESSEEVFHFSQRTLDTDTPTVAECLEGTVHSFADTTKEVNGLTETSIQNKLCTHNPW